jgi:pimeloyl-ACP methyl ester carboxylesterase
MPHVKSKNPADYIVPLNINRLEGRMLRAPSTNAKKKKEILLIYGHHAMLERWWGLVENLEQYGNVTMPDIPGFGGMDSFNKVGIYPNLDAFADYLAAFVKLRYKRKRVTIVAISYGFVIATRMLQKYPELAKKVDLVVSLVGFVHKDDFVYGPKTTVAYRWITRMFATRPVSLMIRYGALNKFVLKTLYSKLPNSKRRMIEVTPEEFDATMDFEVKMWQANDVRTHWLTTSQFFTLDNCSKKIDLPVIHVISQEEHYFDNKVVEQHMRIVFDDYRQFIAKSKAHTPSVLADKTAMSVMLPPGLRRILSKA